MRVINSCLRAPRHRDGSIVSRYSFQNTIASRHNSRGSRWARRPESSPNAARRVATRCPVVGPDWISSYISAPRPSRSCGEITRRFWP